MQKTKHETEMSSASGCGTSCGGSSCCCKKLLVVGVIVAILLNIGANWYFAKMSGSQASVADALRQIQYDQAGGKDIYDLYMKLQKLQAQGQKSKLEEQIKSLEWASAPTAQAGGTNAPSTGLTLSDDEYARIFKDSYVEGKKDAKYTLVEYSDLECPYCIIQRKNKVIQNLKEKYGDTINVLYKPLNLAGHPGADQKGMASLCVAKLGGADKYAKYYGAIMDRSDEQRNSMFSLDKLSALAKEVGVDQKKFDSCYSAKEMEWVYRAYTQEALSFKVNGTPTTMVLNNETKRYELVRGAADINGFQSALDAVK